MADLDNLDVFAKTIYAEARGEPREGQEWVAHVIRNRAEKAGISEKEVCLKPYQFECWNGKSDIPIREPAAFETAKDIARVVMNRKFDPTGGCDHYNNPSTSDPSWTKHPKMRKVKKIGAHQFYKWEG